MLPIRRCDWIVLPRADILAPVVAQRKRQMTNGKRRTIDALAAVRINAVERAQARAMLTASEAIVESMIALHRRAKTLFSGTRSSASA
jgi:hypothetical protein